MSLANFAIRGVVLCDYLQRFLALVLLAIVPTHAEKRVAVVK
jgi:hypothetical protein